jgi:hypothetical protein
MALFSDVDWLVLVAVGAFIFLGPGSGATVRQFGRYYARLMRFKQQLLADLATAAELPVPVSGQGFSIRQSLLDLDSGPSRSSGIPTAVTSPPMAPAVAAPAPTPAPAGFGPTTWAATSPAWEPSKGWSP